MRAEKSKIKQRNPTITHYMDMDMVTNYHTTPTEVLCLVTNAQLLKLLLQSGYNDLYNITIVCHICF